MNPLDWLAYAAPSLAALAEPWAAAMWRACWQGGAVLALAWLVTRAVPRLPARARCWLWRVAYLKLLAALLLPSVVQLPLLPARLQARAATPPQVVPNLTVTPAEAAPVVVLPPAQVTDHAPRRSHSPRLAEVLLWLWLAGVAGAAGRLVFGWGHARRLRRRCLPIVDDRLSDACAGIAGRLALRRPPRLAFADRGAGSGAPRAPLLLGPLDPIVVLPPDVTALHTAAEVRLMLAHELAHLKRGDLWWNWLPASAQALFFFHPLVWLAAREWRLAQETACDEAAVRATGAPPAQYGRMLLGVLASRQPGLSPFPALPATAAAGVVESRKTLRRRLSAMKYFDHDFSKTPARRRAARVAVLLALVLGLVPVTLVARQPAVKQTAGARTADDAAAADTEPEEAAPAAAGEGVPPNVDLLLHHVATEKVFLKTPEAELGAAADGTVVDVKVEEGRAVKKGEVLVQLDSAHAEASLKAARADLELAMVELKRKQALFAKRAPVNELEVSEAEVRVSREQAVVALREHEICQTRVVAPFDGTVARLNVRPGVFVQRGGAVATLVGSGPVWADVNVPALAIARLKKGDRVELRALRSDGKSDTYPARISFISPITRSGSQTVTVRAQVDGAAGAKLRPGTEVTAQLQAEK